jgi:hypothetical protein
MLLADANLKLVVKSVITDGCGEGGKELKVCFKVTLEYLLKLSRVGALSSDDLRLAQTRIGVTTKQQGTKK